MRPPPPTASLTERTAGAAQWRLAGSVLSVLSQFAVGVVLARLLTPADFGLIGLALIVLGIARPIGELGIGNALVQRMQLNDRYIRSAFTFSALLGFIVAWLILISASWTARLLGDSHVAPLLGPLAAGFVFQGMAVAATALLRRRLDFKKQFFIDTVSYLVGYGGVAVVLALFGFGVRSLAWGTAAQMAIASIARMAVVRHPAAPLLGRRELKELLTFGIGAAGVSGVNYVALNGDNFVVGRWIGDTALGLYARAYALMNTPYLYAANVMSGVLFPAFSQVQTEPVRLQRAYLVATRLTATIAAPVLVALAVAAPHLVRGLYGPGWIGVAAPLQILCLAGYFRALYHLGGVVAQSAGRVYNELWRQLIYACLVVVGAIAGSHFGLRGVAVGVGVAILFMFVATGHLALQTTATSWREYLAVQRTAFVAAGITGGVALAVRVLLEARHAPSTMIAVSIIIAAAIPCSVGLAITLGDRDLSALRAQLPPWCNRIVESMGRAAR